jgi:hypothetical protein
MMTRMVTSKLLLQLASRHVAGRSLAPALGTRTADTPTLPRFDERSRYRHALAERFTASPKRAS